MHKPRKCSKHTKKTQLSVEPHICSEWNGHKISLKSPQRTSVNRDCSRDEIGIYKLFFLKFLKCRVRIAEQKYTPTLYGSSGYHMFY